MYVMGPACPEQLTPMIRKSQWMAEAPRLQPLRLDPIPPPADAQGR